MLTGRVAGQGDQIFERVLGVEVRRVADGCVGEVGGGRLGQDGGRGEVQGRGWVRAPGDPTVHGNDGPVVLGEAGEARRVLGRWAIER